jgi:hypothetical protein
LIREKEQNRNGSRLISTGQKELFHSFAYPLQRKKERNKKILPLTTKKEKKEKSRGPFASRPFSLVCAEDSALVLLLPPVGIHPTKIDAKIEGVPDKPSRAPKPERLPVAEHLHVDVSHAHPDTRVGLVDVAHWALHTEEWKWLSELWPVAGPPGGLLAVVGLVVVVDQAQIVEGKVSGAALNAEDGGLGSVAAVVRRLGTCAAESAVKHEAFFPTTETSSRESEVKRRITKTFAVLR